MLDPGFKTKLPQVIDLLKKHKVSKAFAFGSVCSIRFNEKSDIDLLISFDPRLEPLEKGELWWDLVFALEDTLKRQVDLITESSLSNPYLIQSIDSNKELIYAA